jgi:hypothetical protein
LFGIVQIYKQLREDMKKLLKLSLAVMAIAALAACGDGGSSDAADVYVGSWKSGCFSYTGNDGNTYYSTTKMNLAKASGAELAGSYSDRLAYSNNACTNRLGALDNYAPFKINIGAKTTFLGGSADAIVMTFTNNEARTGFISADATRLNLVITDASGQRPGGWGATSPYTKQ